MVVGAYDHIVFRLFIVFGMQFIILQGTDLGTVIITGGRQYGDVDICIFPSRGHHRPPIGIIGRMSEPLLENLISTALETVKAAPGNTAFEPFKGQASSDGIPFVYVVIGPRSEERRVGKEC